MVSDVFTLLTWDWGWGWGTDRQELTLFTGACGVRQVLTLFTGGCVETGRYSLYLQEARGLYC